MLHRRVEVELVVAVAEGDQALAAAVLAHVGEGGGVEPVPLQHDHVDPLERLDQLGEGPACVAHDRAPDLADGPRLLLEARRVEGVAAGRADVQDSGFWGHVLTSFHPRGRAAPAWPAE